MVLKHQLLSLIPSLKGTLWLSILLLVAFIIWRRYLSQLSAFPGPFWASVTDLWRWLMVRRGRPHKEQLELHQAYGDVVRLGPNSLSFASPQAVSDIYAGKKGLRKVRQPFWALTHDCTPKKSAPETAYVSQDAMLISVNLTSVRVLFCSARHPRRPLNQYYVQHHRQGHTC